MTVLAACLLRPVYLGQIGATQTARRAVMRRAAVGDDPIAWKMQLVDGAIPGGGFRWFPRWAALAGLAIAAAGAEIAEQSFGWNSPIRLHAVALGGLLGLLVTVRVCSAVPLEHQHQTFDALLLTGRSIGEVINSMYLGVFRAFRPILLTYSAATMATAVCFGPKALLIATGSIGLLWVVVWMMAIMGFAFAGLDDKLLNNIAGALVCAAGLLWVVGILDLILMDFGMRVLNREPYGPWLAWAATLAIPLATWVTAGACRNLLLGTKWDGRQRDWRALARPRPARWREIPADWRRSAARR
jgi:hypothetical protein